MEPFRMESARTAIPALGLSLSIAPQWCRVSTEAIANLDLSLVSVDEAHLPLGQHLRAVGATLESAEDGLAEWMRREMRKDVRQGWPEITATTIGGRPALLAEWTDGVRNIVSGFVIGPIGAVRFDVFAPGAYFGDVAESRELAATVFDSVVWDER